MEHVGRGEVVAINFREDIPDTLMERATIGINLRACGQIQLHCTTEEARAFHLGQCVKLTLVNETTPAPKRGTRKPGAESFST